MILLHFHVSKSVLMHFLLVLHGVPFDVYFTSRLPAQSV